MAKKAGLKYFASVPWEKEGFVSNCGRKAKNTETVMIFTKGKARSLRHNAKKEKASPGQEISVVLYGSEPPFVVKFRAWLFNCMNSWLYLQDFRFCNLKLGIDLLEQILQLLTKPGELGLDQFAGSGSFGEACQNSGHPYILIELGEKECVAIKERLNLA